MGQADRGLSDSYSACLFQIRALPNPARYPTLARSGDLVAGAGNWAIARTFRRLCGLLCRQVSSHRTQSLVIVGRSLQGSTLFKRGRGVLESGRNLLEPQRSCRQRADFRGLDLRSALVGFILEEGFVN